MKFPWIQFRQDHGQSIANGKHFIQQEHFRLPRCNRTHSLEQSRRRLFGDSNGRMKVCNLESVAYLIQGVVPVVNLVIREPQIQPVRLLRLDLHADSYLSPRK